MKRSILYISSLFFFSVYSLTNSYSQVISAGEIHSTAICIDGTVKAWGHNEAGQLGLGTYSPNEIVPNSVLGLTGVKMIACGGFNSIALKDDSTVWGWGQNNRGMLGLGDTLQRNIPTQVPTLSGIVAIATEAFFTIALKSDGTVWSWGTNDVGQLGNGTLNDSWVPIQVIGLTGIKVIAAGSYHALALRNDGTLWAWGWNDKGQLGDSSLINRWLPVQVHNVSDVSSIACGGNHSVIIKNDGTVWAWGYNVYGQLGDGTTLNRRTPVQVSGLTDVLVINSGWWHTLAIKYDGTMWAWGYNAYGQLGDGSSFNSPIPIQVPGMSGTVAIAGGLYHTLAVKSDSTVWAWGSNIDGQIGDSTTINRSLPVLVHNMCDVYPRSLYRNHYIHGYLYRDSTNDCIRQPGEDTFPFLPVMSIPGNNYTASNSSGYYSLGGNDSVNYSVSAVIPQLYQYMISDPCPISSSVYFTATSSHDTSGFDFGFDGNPCWQLRVDVSGNRKRRCFRNYTTVNYRNEGLIAADSVKVYVKFAEYDIPIASSMPYTIDASDSSLVFDIGTLAPWQSGTIAITDSIACIPNVTGLTQCTEAWILPENECLIDSTTGPGWDHSSTGVEAECVNDTCRFVIHNNGSGNMTTPQPYRVYANNVLVYTGSYQLASGDSLVVLWVSGGATIRLEADQHPDHPGHSHPRATLEGCGDDGSGNFTIGEVNDAPMDDEGVEVEIDCMQIVDSYDPNDKQNSPEGIDAAHIILPNTPVDFTIRFQNTGTDTAYKVVIIDSLSNDLDLATLELGAASHAYTTSLSGQGVAVLKFTFNNINLVDSTMDELNSHGFIKYKITPKASVPLGTRINNAADIYFDYNFPVRTNTAFVTLGDYSTLSVGDSRVGQSPSVRVFPNPTTGFITIESAKNNPIQGVNVYGVDGRVLKSIFNFQLSTFNLDLKDLTAGIYFFDCHTTKGSEKVKVIKY